MTDLKISPVPKKAENTIQEYVKYFDRIVVANGWSDSDAARMFAGMLEIGSTVIDDFDVGTSGSWASLKKELIPHTECYREVAVKKFFALEMGRNETVEAFQKKCRDIVQACYPRFAKANRELLIRDRFVHGLSSNFKKVVLNQRSEKLDEAMQAALMAENVRETLGTDVNQGARQQWRGAKDDKQPVGLKCFKCKQVGHFARHCPAIGKVGTEQKWYPKKNVSCVEKCSGRPKVDAVVNGCKIKLLVDSGASVSLLPKNKFEATEHTTSCLRTADNSPLEVSGTLHCSIKLQNWVGEHCFYVGDVTVPVLGMDFMRHHGAIIDAKAGKLIMSTEPIKPVEEERLTTSGVGSPSSDEDDLYFIAVVDKAKNCDVPLANTRDLVPELNNGVDMDEANREGDQEIEKLRKSHKVVFEGLGFTDLVTHEIKTGDGSPICVPSHRLPIHLLGKAQKQIEELTEKGIIKKSNSAWTNPVVIVPKKSGDVRIAIDFRRLNEMCHKDAFPMPRVDECLEQLKGAKVFTTLDCNSGYYQIGVEVKDQPKTAFKFNGDLWEFTRMPFGLAAAPATFCRLMRVLFAGESNIVCYLDDICIFSESLEEHRHHLVRALDILRDAGMTLNLEKCKFVRQEITFLGFQVGNDQIRPSSEKWKAMKDFPKPRNIKELHRFLGLVGYYRSLIPHFGLMTAPLYGLTRKNVKFVWDTEQNRAFETVKEALLKEVVRCIPDPGKPFIVRTDACADGVGALLLQEDDSGQRRIVECASKHFNECQKRYPVIEQEAYGIMWAIDRWERFLLGAKFVLETDHRPLEWLKTKKDCRGKLGRWALRLMSFDLEIKHIPGKSNVDADALSRAAVSCIGIDKIKLQQAQIKDKELERYKNQEPSKYEERNGLLYRTDEAKILLCLPKTYRKQVWNHFHDKFGHSGPLRVLELAKNRFYWPKMRQDLKKWAKECIVCAIHKDFLPTPATAPMMEVDHSNLEPMEKVAIDVMGPFPTAADGSKYLFVLVDLFTKWAEVTPVESIGAENIIKWLRTDIFTRFSIPREIVADRGANMESSDMKSFCEKLGIKLTYTSAYHHQSNPVERLNRTLLNMLRVYVSGKQDDWPKYVPLVTFAYRCLRHEAIKVSPFEAMLGRQPRFPIDCQLGTQLDSVKGLEQLMEQMTQIRGDMRTALRNSAKKTKSDYDRAHKVKIPTFKLKELVYLRQQQVKKGRAKKLAEQWLGPYILFRQISPVNWVIKGNGPTERVVHINLLKPCQGNEDRTRLAQLRGRGRPKRVT